MSDERPTAPLAARIGSLWPYGLLLAVAAFVLLRGLGSFGLWDPWEPTHAEAAERLRVRGTLAVGADSPLTYWSILAGSAVFGRDELGARVGGALLALASMLVTYYCVARLRGARAGLLSAIVLGSSPLFYFLARQAMPEVYLLTTIGMSLLLFCTAWFGGERRRMLHCAAGALAAALALLAGRPLVTLAGVGLPLACCALARLGGGESAAAVRDAAARRRALKALLLVAIVVLVVAGPWYGIVLARHAHPLELLGTVQPASLTDDWRGGFDYYVRGWIFGFFPWSCLLPLALVALAATRGRDAPFECGLEVCMLLSALAVWVVISVPQEKFQQALAPIAVPVAVAIGTAIDRMLRERGASTSVAWLVAAMLYLPAMIDLLRAKGLRYLIGSFTPERDVPQEVDPGRIFVLLVVLVAPTLIGLAFVRSRVLVGVLAACAVGLAGHNAVGLIAELSPQRTMKGVCEAWRDRDAATATVGFVGEPVAGLRYYVGDRLRMLRDEESFMQYMDPRQPAFTIIEKEKLVAYDREYRRRFEGSRLYLLHRDRSDYMLLGNRE